ncbi:MAG: 4Fe-4S dicluster domain-containing protein [Hungatella sp.]|nr:4Fe-4S dicluster domain-containing protein [Hungatella sp.]
MDMKKLGFGLMRLPLLDKADAASVDVEQVKRMVDLFLERGFTYFDTAWMYCGFNSENTAKTALVDRYPREAYTLATKLHSGFFNSLEDRDKVFDEQREKTGVEYFDYYLLHGISESSYGKYEEFDCFNWLREKKSQGLVKHIGFSFHDNAELLDKILTAHPDMEFVQLQINYLDWESPWIQSRKCYETAVKHGVPVIVMEPVKGGTLASVPQRVDKLFKDYDPEMSVPSWAVRFAASLDNVMMVLSGMSNVEQLMDNVSYMEDFKPFGEQEKELVRKAADMINEATAVPCTGCSYCTDGCPAKIAIPQYFSLYNEDMREAEDKGWTANQTNYKQLAGKFGKAGDCIGCGQCESICPQHLPIIKHLQDVSAHYDR